MQRRTFCNRTTGSITTVYTVWLQHDTRPREYPIVLEKGRVQATIRDKPHPRGDPYTKVSVQNQHMRVRPSYAPRTTSYTQVRLTGLCQFFASAPPIGPHVKPRTTLVRDRVRAIRASPVNVNSTRKIENGPNRVRGDTRLVYCIVHATSRSWNERYYKPYANRALYRIHEKDRKTRFYLLNVALPGSLLSLGIFTPPRLRKGCSCLGRSST